MKNEYGFLFATKSKQKTRKVKICSKCKNTSLFQYFNVILFEPMKIRTRYCFSPFEMNLIYITPYKLYNTF